MLDPVRRGTGDLQRTRERADDRRDVQHLQSCGRNDAGSPTRRSTTNRNCSSAHHYVDVRNNGVIAGLPDKAVVEVPAHVDRAGAHPLSVAPLAPELLGLVQAVTAYEVLTIEAARTGSRDAALRALLAHPLVGEWDVAVPLLEEILAANSNYLPAFAG
ncbi:MAG TPA: hypothetical protein VE442_24950 [Jatrophihabitans sp.]|nr:hypothetical protein [Jatrophihabitans sp.]